MDTLTGKQVAEMTMPVMEIDGCTLKQGDSVTGDDCKMFLSGTAVMLMYSPKTVKFWSRAPAAMCFCLSDCAGAEHKKDDADVVLKVAGKGGNITLTMEQKEQANKLYSRLKSLMSLVHKAEDAGIVMKAKEAEKEEAEADDDEPKRPKDVSKKHVGKGKKNKDTKEESKDKKTKPKAKDSKKSKDTKKSTTDGKVKDEKKKKEEDKAEDKDEKDEEAKDSKSKSGEEESSTSSSDSHVHSHEKVKKVSEGPEEVAAN